jgi:pyruvate,water dikinase
LIRFGEDLVSQELLAGKDDVFMVTFDELREIVRAEVTPSLRTRVRDLIEQRKTEMEIARTLEPPPFIGNTPPERFDVSNPGGRAMLNFFGGPPKESENENEILGNPGSRGTVTGSARIALSLDDAKNLQAGEILIARTTMPAWTPLFGVAAAVVTETGGSLSHCAIVAREYGIPAVVGAFGVTRRIAPGQRITVDGTRGIVTLH